MHSQKHKLANMTLICVTDEKRTIKSLCAMIDKAPTMDVFKLEDGTEGDIIVLSKALCQHPCLEEFNMTSVSLTNSSLSMDDVLAVMLVSVPDLMHVKLEKVPVSSSASAAAGSCTSTKPPMHGYPCLTEFDMFSLPQIDPLLTLSQVLNMIIDSIPELEYVELKEVPVSSSASAAAGSYATSLETPIDSKSGLADEDAIKLAEAASSSALAAAGSYATSLETPIVSKSGLADEDTIKLAEAAPSSASAAAGSYATSLETPIVSKSGLADEDVIKLAEAVVQSPSVQCIDISGSDLSNRAGADQSPSIESIDISGIGLSDPKYDPFATDLDKNSSIHTIRRQGSGKISGEQRTQNETTLRDRAGGKAHAA
jgi:hypothetical protein